MSSQRLVVDVAILGGGLTGCAAAYYLGKRGKRVALAERGFVGGESSGVNFGNLRLQGHHFPELPIALRAQALWEGLEAEIGDSVEYHRCGHVHVALNEEHVETIRRHAVGCRPYGLEVELVEHDEMRRRWPFLGEQALAASYSARDAVLNPRLVSPAFARAAEARGATVLEQTEIVSVEHQAGAFLLRAASGLTIEAPCLINAAGVWGGAIAAQFGEAVPTFPAGPVQIVTEPMPRFAGPVMHAVDGSILFRQHARGNVQIAGHPRITVDAETRRTRVPPLKMATNMARIGAFVPRLRGQHVIRCWTGIEGYLPDMLPAFGPSLTTPGLFHAFAFSGHGLQIGPAVGTILAELIIDGGTETPIDLFSLARFRENAVQTDRGALKQEFYDDVLDGAAAPRAEVTS